MKWKASKGSAWDVAKRLGGVLVVCLLAILAAETVRLIAHDKAWAQEPTPVVVVQATPTPAPTPVPTGNPLLDLWQNADVRNWVIAGVIGAIIVLVFQRVLPWLWQKGGQLLSRLVGALRFKKLYLEALMGEHRYLKLVGVEGAPDLRQPRRSLCPFRWGPPMERRKASGL
jgi:hypothetical protein